MMEKQQGQPTTRPDLSFALLSAVYRQDENLFIAASARWDSSRQGVLELMVAAPDIRTSINLLSHQHLNLETFLKTRWQAYWEARAPGTPSSRRDLATRLYRQHFEAAGQLVLAQGILSAEELKPVLAIVNSSDEEITIEGRPVRAQQLILMGTDGRKTELPGAFVITVETADPLGQLLYLPGSQAALIPFNQRFEMENWLFQHPELFTGVTRIDAQCTMGYRTQSRPLEAGIEQLLAQAVDAQCERARKAREDDLATEGSDALQDADQQDQLRRAHPVFASPPDFALAASAADSEMDDVFMLFGLMHADIPVSTRRHALAQQQAALETFLGDYFQGSQDEARLQQLKTCLESLAAAEQHSRAAASALLNRNTALLMLELRQQSNPDYADLYQARREGLRIEADIQRLLNQISVDEHRMLEAVLDQPKAADRAPDVVVASLSLSATEADDSTTLRTQSLDGPLVIASPAALQNEVSPQGVLLYWPGSSGGLQRFASRLELERGLFKTQAHDSELALHLSPLQGDPFEFGLQNQLHTCEQKVTRLIADYRGSSQAEQRAVELEKLRVETLAALRVPVNEAREQAYAQIVEQQHSSVLAGKLPQWLGKLSEADRSRFKASIRSFIEAMKRAHELFERELPHRDDFSRQRIDARLRKDFSLEQHFEVTLDLPDSTSWQRTIVDGAAPGTPLKNVLVPSQGRSKMSLAELAQANIDNALWWRLSFMTVEVIADSPAQRDALLNGITTTYLRAFVTELDLAQKYEDLIVGTFMGSASATAFSNEHRRECLIEPWRLMLKMQGDSALHQKQIDEQGWKVLSIAIDACTPEAYAADGKRIVLLPGRLTVGGVDTDEGPTTLSGVTFIEDRISGLTLLYLPDSPDGRFFHQRDSLEQARKKLFELCLHTEMVTYLAGRALKGDYARHLSRINQALIKNFDPLIGMGEAWPATTSMAANQLNAHMGRLIEAHRATSRSNSALYLERYALKGGAMFNYVKMALGIVPFVGAAIALYDAWGSANLAVAAFLRGEVGHGLAQLESVLLSLIDAAMDTLPGASVGAGANPGVARALTRTRQAGAAVKSAAALHRPSLRKARHVADRFEGYEYAREVSLVGLQPESQGIYRNVYRHADGDFIIRQGRLYRVQLIERTLRLYGTHSRSYKQPIALDETGNWDTHFAVYGSLMNEGLSGGGNSLGRLADGLDPVWPTAIRQWLPRWWTDGAYRRQQLLGQSIDALTRQLDNQHRSTNRALAHYHDSPEVTRLPTQAAVDAACVNDIDLAGRQFAQLEQLLPLSRGNKRASVKSLQSHMAVVVVNRHVHRLNLARERCLACLDEINGITDTIANVPTGEVLTALQLTRQSRGIRIKLIQGLDQMDADVDQITAWRRRIVEDEHKKLVAEDLADLEKNLTAGKRDYIKTLNYLTVVSNFEKVRDPSWFYLQETMRRARDRVYDALFAQQNLPDVVANRAQRNRVLEECIEVYDQFHRDINVLSASDAQHFHLDQIPMLLDHLKKMSAHARTGIKSGVAQREGAASSGMKVFETDGNRLLIGVEEVDPVTRQTRFTTPGEGRAENWLPKADGRYQRQAAPAFIQPEPPVDVNSILAEARARLAAQDDYLIKVRGYANQNMLPVDLEYMLTREAGELNLRAERIQRLSPNHAVIVQLTDKALALTQTGRSLRIAHTLKSKTPTQGYLDFLIDAATPDEKVVDIQKVGGLQELGRNPDGRRDFLQEYLIRDLTQETPRPLWYAHFHYGSAKPVFNSFVKAHLKLPEQRSLGLKWQQGVAHSGAQVEPIWRGDINLPLALKHFQSLF